MRSICFYFQVHQPYRLKNYRFFNMGNDHHYYDEYLNRSITERVAEKSYLPMNKLLLDLIQKHGKEFKVSFSITGLAIEQFEKYAPAVLESFKKLAATGQVEFLAETYAHSLVSLKNNKEFKKQVEMHKKKIKDLFDIEPVTFRNTELIYSDDIGSKVAEMGFKTVLTEGAKHILGWRSPNFLYQHPEKKKLNILLKNFRLSDDIAFRFSSQTWSEWPLTTDKYLQWLKQIQKEDEVVNLFMDYETFGEHQWAATGIFEFMRVMPGKIIADGEFKFKTPSELTKELKPVSELQVPYPISWADEERDLSAWLGNEMQDEAFEKLYQMAEKMEKVTDPAMNSDWLKLQTSDHFYYMCTKWFSDGDVHDYFNPYPSPYEAFINYMNVLADFQIRLEEYTYVAKNTNSLNITFEEIEAMSIAKLKKVLSQLEVEDIAKILSSTNESINEKVQKYLGKKKQKALSDMEEIKDYSMEQLSKTKKALQNLL